MRMNNGRALAMCLFRLSWCAAPPVASAARGPRSLPGCGNCNLPSSRRSVRFARNESMKIPPLTANTWVYTCRSVGTIVGRARLVAAAPFHVRATITTLTLRHPLPPNSLAVDCTVAIVTCSQVSAVSGLWECRSQNLTGLWECLWQANTCM
jgi:hypothetical protein